jgi:hypothetical protein
VTTPAAEQAEELQRQSDLKKEQAFKEFLQQPLTCMAISMMPPGETQDALKSLLQATFNEGFRSGSGDMLRGMLGVLIPTLKRKDKE